MRRPFALLATWLLSLLMLSTHAHASYTASYVFGDSLSDTGNYQAFAATYAPSIALQPPYWNGRFSNGPVFAEIVSNALGLSANPSFLGGTNYAIGGARASGHEIPQLSQAASINGQVGSYLLGHGGVASNSALYTLYIGSNDVFDAVKTFGSTLTSTGDLLAAQAAAMSLLDSAADLVGNALLTLADAGAKTIVMPTITDLGLTPRIASNNAGSIASALASSFNGLVDNLIQSVLGTHSGLRVVRPDIYALLDNAVANPGSLGLTNVTDACYSGFGAAQDPNLDTLCSDPNTYLFWDEVHPTAVGHQAIANAVLVALPEPQAWLLVGLALALLMLARRRSI